MMMIKNYAFSFSKLPKLKNDSLAHKKYCMGIYLILSATLLANHHIDANSVMTTNMLINKIDTYS